MIEYKITIFNNYKCEFTMTMNICDGKATCNYSSTVEKIKLCLN